MQPNARPEPVRTREDAPASQGSSGYRQSQGYITLSPARRNKERSKLERNSDKFEIEHERSVSGQLGQYPLVDSVQKENENGDNLPIRTEQFFKKIPKFTPQEITVREAFAEGLMENASAKKKKLSVTKLFNNIEISNRSQDGASVTPSYKLAEFDAEK